MAFSAGLREPLFAIEYRINRRLGRLPKVSDSAIG